MAKKEAKGTKDTQDDNAPKKKSKLSGVTKIFGPLFKVISLVSLLVLFGGVYSLQFIDLRATLYPLGGWFLIAFAVCAPLSMLFKAKPAVSAVGVEEGVDTGGEFAKFRETVNKKVLGLESQISAFLATHYDVLKEENEKYKTELNAIEEEKSQKVISELDELRQRNAELQEQLNNLLSSSPNTAPSMVTPISSIPDEIANDEGIMPAPPNEAV